MLQSGTPPPLPFFFFPLAALLCSPSRRKSFFPLFSSSSRKIPAPLFLEYEDHGKGDADLNRNVMAPRIVRWLTPPQGRLKLNVDGAFNMTTNEAGGGGILRDHKGNMYCAFANHYKDLESSLVVEALASEMDCSCATTRLLRPWDFAFILQEIVVIAKKVQAAITYVPRESNKVADCLAKFAYSCAHLTTWDSEADLPSTVKESYRLDKEGCPSMRPNPPSYI
ncbi:hypothetical protein Taro_003311 [Colocasia esculenta]|uniref:RNase H type-1 domain-containing protein n=1 Tax=Colocasia esculenta TaxID=4460 RepID=A0A843TF31_COLES|nr:hypothetical protein [Colocasia esculenta]